MAPRVDNHRDLGLGSAMKIVGGQGVGDMNEGSASKEGGASQNSVASESSLPEGNKDTAKLPGGGVEMAGLREDQYEAQSWSLHRMGIMCASPNFKRPQSLQNLKLMEQKEGYSVTISHGDTTQPRPNGTTTTTCPPRQLSLPAHHSVRVLHITHSLQPL